MTIKTTKQCPDTAPECAASAKAFGQSIEDGRPHAHYENEANPEIIIDETARPLQVIRVETSENEPAFWKVGSTKDDLLPGQRLPTAQI